MINLSFVSPVLYFDILKTEKMLQFGMKKILDMHGTSWTTGGQVNV